ncbi:IS3 family transposase [Corynebacterium sp. EPI-003-04-2554_SCH2473622]|uniref:IS3 family transposase n=1 Tax=Corynebacterium sp. EPI-003-04-2554_SCH2473622 TaxID=1834153 RepID=UPI003515B7E5
MSACRLRDAALLEHLHHVHADNYGVYGVRNMRHALQREGIDIGRAQTYPPDALGRSVRQRLGTCHHPHAQGARSAAWPR